MLRPNPIPKDLARYLENEGGIPESDIKICERVSGFDRFRVILNNGFEFFISGPTLESYNTWLSQQ
jgi:hypothetical protein